jgi:hypothetical protein
MERRDLTSSASQLMTAKVKIAILQFVQVRYHVLRKPDDQHFIALCAKNRISDGL